MHKKINLLAIIFLSLLFLFPGCNESEGEMTNILPVEGENRFSPITSFVIAKPDPVLGSDGRYHMVYELQITNVTSLIWTINSIEIIDANSNEVFASFEGEEVTAKIQTIATRTPINTLEPEQSGIVFLTFSVESAEDIPANITHRFKITVPGGIPDGFANFAGIPPGSEEYTEFTGQTGVNPPNAILLSPPLKGDNWVAADGCCTAVRHVRGYNAVNGKIFFAQRFAIDWEKINEEKRIFVGDPLDVTNYFAYGEDVIAVADATVVTVVNGFEDQVPGQLPPGITLAEADGNHVVLDLGSGRFALYAHLIKDSITVEVGEQVVRGQVLGLLGNSGNTTAPHLHFHVMDSSSSLGSNGLPYMYDNYELIEMSASTEAFDEAEATGIPLETVPVANPGIHTDDLMLDQSIVNFE
ncbi:MAG: M23 family metallopeptidase [Thermodesulfobacteriota bacterium]